jgi:hypothetical protein
MSSAVRAVFREITWRRLVVAQIITITWLAIRYINTRYFPPAQLPSTFILSGFVIDELTAISLLIGIFAGRESVSRGVPPLIAYLTPLLIAGVLVGVSQYYLRHLLGLHLVVDELSMADAVMRKQFNMLYIGLDTVIYGAFIMLVYTNREYELDCVRRMRAAELERANVERELTHARLADAQARLDPQVVLPELAHIKQLYETESGDAESALNALAQKLRRQLDSLPVT